MKRTTPLRRTSSLRTSSTLRRRSHLRARSRTNSYRKRERFFAYMLAVKSLPCTASDLGGCCGELHADHAGRRGIGQKCHDREVISLCARHHAQRTDFSGPFRSWSQAEMRAWLIAAIETTQRLAMAKGITVP